MANRVMIDMSIREKYKDVPEDIITNLIRPEVWSNDIVTNADGYNLPQNLSEIEIDALLDQIRNSIHKGRTSGEECQMLVIAASYLRSAGRIRGVSMLSSRNFGEESPKWKPEIASVVASSSKSNLKTEQERTYGLFVCSFLFKILSKSPENVDRSWDRNHERYSNFYNGASPSKWPKPPKGWLESLKRQFEFDRRAAKTAIKIVVALEKQYPDSNLIRYLFAVPLSYTGMHAYKLFCDVMERMKKPNAWLLYQLKNPLNNAALKSIAEILDKFELTESRTDTSYRYARLLGPQYFQPLQTKACPALVYCLVQILNHYDGHTDAENIFGLQFLGSHIKMVMKTAADMIFNASQLED